jgi:hypothetical protein
MKPWWALLDEINASGSADSVSSNVCWAADTDSTLMETCIAVVKAAQEVGL